VTSRSKQTPSNHPEDPSNRLATNDLANTQHPRVMEATSAKASVNGTVL